MTTAEGNDDGKKELLEWNMAMIMKMTAVMIITVIKDDYNDGYNNITIDDNRNIKTKK